MNPIFFDAGFYLSQNPDVARAVASGTFANAFAHFTQFGQFENRDPNTFFDVSFYLESNPDVAAAIANGTATSAYSHFVAFGQFEARDPDADFDSDYYLAENPDVAAAVANGTIPSAFAHFLQFGQFEGVVRAPNATFATFDEAAYLEANPDVAAAVEAGIFPNAFAHFLEFGRNENRPGTPETEPTEPPVEPPVQPPVTPPDTTPPARPTLELDPASDTGIVGDNTTADTTPTLIGQAEPGSTVIIRSGTTDVGDVVAGSDGSFRFTLPEQEFGDRSFTAVAVDAAGNESVASEELNVTIDPEASVATITRGATVLEFATVEAAFAEAQEGDTIDIGPGEYAGPDLTISVANLTVRGANAGVSLTGPTPRGAETVLEFGIIITASATGTTINGLTVDGTLENTTAEGASIFNLATGVSILNNVIIGDPTFTRLVGDPAVTRGATGIVNAENAFGLDVIGNSISSTGNFGIYVNPLAIGTDPALIQGNVFSGDTRIPIVVEPNSAGQISGRVVDNDFSTTNERGDVVVFMQTGANIDVTTAVLDNSFSEDAPNVEVLAVPLSTVTGSNFDDLIRIGEGAGFVSVNGGAGDDIIIGSTTNNDIRGGFGVDILTGGGGSDFFLFGAGETGITFETADLITDFNLDPGDAIDFLGSAAGSADNYSEGASAVASFDAALLAANDALGGSVIYNFQFIAGAGGEPDVGLLFHDRNADGTADEVIRLTGVTNVDFEFGLIA